MFRIAQKRHIIQYRAQHSSKTFNHLSITRLKVQLLIFVNIAVCVAQKRWIVRQYNVQHPKTLYRLSLSVNIAQNVVSFVNISFCIAPKCCIACIVNIAKKRCIVGQYCIQHRLKMLYCLSLSLVIVNIARLASLKNFVEIWKICNLNKGHVLGADFGWNENLEKEQPILSTIRIGEKNRLVWTNLNSANGGKVNSIVWNHNYTVLIWMPD